MGLGAGVVVGALLLQLMYFADSMERSMPPLDSVGEAQNGANDTTPSAALTLQELGQEADRLGFKLYPASDVLYTQQELDEALAQALADKADAKPSSEFHTFRILPGMKAGDVAE